MNRAEVSMKIHFVTEGSLNGFWDKTEGIDCDVIVFGFNGLENVYYANWTGKRANWKIWQS